MTLMNLADQNSTDIVVELNYAEILYSSSEHHVMVLLGAPLQ